MATQDTSVTTESPSLRRRVSRRLVILLVLAASVLIATLSYMKFYVARPVGSGPAGPKIKSGPFAAQWSQTPVRIVAFGDSITAGLGAKSRDHNYVQRLVVNPDDEFPDMQGKCLSKVLPEATVENFAISGTTSLQHVDQIDQNLATFSPDEFGLVLITTGGNDIIHNYGRTPPREGAMFGATFEQAKPWIKNFRERLEGMITTFNRAFPGGCEIYLADIYDPTDGDGDGASIFLPPWPDGLRIHAQYNATIQAVAANHSNVFRVPLHAEFLGHGAHSQKFWHRHYRSDDPYYWYFNNVEDPNDRGYDAIRRVFLQTILDNTSLR